MWAAATGQKQMRQVLGRIGVNFEKVVSNAMPAGTFRFVMLIGQYAVKMPRFRHFAAGCRCNRWEREIWRVWRPKFDWQHLCPVLAADPFGLVLVMPRAEQPVTFEEVISASPDYYPEPIIEAKPEDFGHVAGDVVVLDYGLWDANQVLKRREYYQTRS